MRMRVHIVCHWPRHHVTGGCEIWWDTRTSAVSLLPTPCLLARRKVVLNTITSGPADISMVAVKFAESVVLACVGGRGLAPGASREGDKSVQRNLSPSHPFLLADTLDQAGHALARQMVGWLGTSGSGSDGGGGGGGGAKASNGSGGAAKGTGWGSGFGAQHYTVLINALQNLATNRAALFGDIVPALASALESVNGNGSGRSKVALEARGGGKKGPTAGAIVPKGLRDAGGSLRSACLKLLKVAPGPSVGVQRLAVAAALSGSDGEAKAAVGGNATLKGRIKLPVRVRERPVVRAGRRYCIVTVRGGVAGGGAGGGRGQLTGEGGCFFFYHPEDGCATSCFLCQCGYISSIMDT